MRQLQLAIVGFGTVGRWLAAAVHRRREWLATECGVQFRLESTVMSGTPVLSTLREGSAGTRVLALNGILNGTANHILTLMAEGRDYPAALADAQAHGYAEPDPADDVEGHDVVAKARILAALAFGRAVPLDQVWRRGITDITPEAVRQATRADGRIKLVASLRLRSEGEAARPDAQSLEVRVEPVMLPLSEPLARVDGVQNALSIETDTVSRVMVIGPGAGREQAGQGIFADLAAIARAQ